MITKKDIQDFYEHITELGLKFPVAAISTATGYSKGQVSEILNLKQDPTENFLKMFYEKFPKSSNELELKRAAIELSRIDRLIAIMESHAESIARLSKANESLAAKVGSGETGIAFSLSKDVEKVSNQGSQREVDGDKSETHSGKKQRQKDSGGGGGK